MNRVEPLGTVFHPFLGAEEGYPDIPASMGQQIVSTNSQESETVEPPTVSTVFHSSFNFEEGCPDVMLVSVDEVIFYAHQRRLLRVSENNFGGTLPPAPIPQLAPFIAFPGHSNVLNMALHAIYDIPCQTLQPTLEILLASMEALKAFGIPLSEHLKPSKPLFQDIISLMPLKPMNVFVFAAENDSEELAALCSSYLLSYDLSTISDPMAERMGPIYLKRLFLLHAYRLKVLKTLLVEPPKHHIPTLTCCFEDQQALSRAWSLACLSFAWEHTPGMVRKDYSYRRD